MGNVSLRELNQNEKHLIERLLREDFPGRDVLSSQVATSLVGEIDANGSLTFAVRPDAKADVRSRVPVEGEFEDTDGVTIHVLLHVVDGMVNELEIYREDSLPISSLPDVAALRVFHVE